MQEDEQEEGMRQTCITLLESADFISLRKSCAILGMRDPRNLFDLRLGGRVLPRATSARAGACMFSRPRPRDLAASDGQQDWIKSKIELWQIHSTSKFTPIRNTSNVNAEVIFHNCCKKDAELRHFAV